METEEIKHCLLKYLTNTYLLSVFKVITFLNSAFVLYFCVCVWGEGGGGNDLTVGEKGYFAI